MIPIMNYEGRKMKKTRRGSKQKNAVLNAAKELASHPTAQEIFFKAKEEVMSISFGTVYRNLGVLVDDGDLITITSPGSEAHYDHNVKNHCHIQCSICGKVRDLDFPAVDFQGILPSDASGFTVDGVCVTFTGMCRYCKETKEKENFNEC